jgi:glycosyltransferase involved in cell wall biosynthesis
MRKALSVVVTTYNEEKNILRCLSSVRWADEIVLIDSFSTDRTIEIAETFGVKIIQRDYPGSSRQVEYGIGQTTNDWIFVIDADEEVSNELRDEIESILSTNDLEFISYDVPRQVFFLGRWIKYSGWYPDYQLRFFRKDSIYPVHAEVHGHFEPKSSKGKLKGLLYHYTYHTLYDYLKRINYYTSLHVSNKMNEQKIKKVKWYLLVIHPIAAFLRLFISNKGYKDGFQGLILSLFSSVYTMVLYAKIWEYHKCKEENSELPPITNSDFQNRKDYR